MIALLNTNKNSIRIEKIKGFKNHDSFDLQFQVNVYFYWF